MLFANLRDWSRENNLLKLFLKVTESDHNVKPMYNHKNYSTVIIRDSRDMLRVLLVQGASLTHFRASLVNKIVRTY